MKTLPPFVAWRRACLCHEARLRFGKAMWAWLDDDCIPLRERFAVASRLLFGETTCH
jgi:hypothetical protein